MESYSIIQNARKKLVTLICKNVISLYKKIGLPKPEEDEPYIIEAENLLRPFSIDVEVDNSYLDIDDTCYERQAVSSIMADADGTVTVATENGESSTEIGEFSAESLSIEALCAISDALELTYKSTK